MKRNKTTPEHFELFKQEAEKWIDFYGLKDWRFCFYHEEGLENSAASYGYNIQGRIVSIYLEPDWQHQEITEEQLKRSAFHEVTHILLARLREMALNRVAFEVDIDEEIHSIIRTLEKVLFGREERGEEFRRLEIEEELRHVMGKD